MTGKAALGWFLIITGAGFLLFGVLGNDMGGLVRLGYSPDIPLSLERAPGRFLLGVLLHGGMIVIGIRSLCQARAADQDDPRRRPS